ncbi:MAG: ATP-dependent Clp protease ATP-binding subunit, partial [Hyphomonadaceae bacterium]
MLDTPRWVRDLGRFLPLRSQFLLTGNVRDRYPAPISGTLALLPLIEYLTYELSKAGIARVVAFDPISGFYLPNALDEDLERNDAAFFSELGLRFDEAGRCAVSLERFFETLPQLVTQPREPVAVIVDFASRLLVRPDHLSEAESRSFTRGLVLAHRVEPQPHPKTRQASFNPVIWIADKEGDLPD